MPFEINFLKGNQTSVGSIDCSPERWRMSLSEIASDHGVEWGYVNVVVLTDEEHKGLNNKYLGHDYSTDVLTFDLSMEGDLSGEVYVNEAVLRKNAKEYGVSDLNELDRLVMHGALHLVGYEDSDEAEKKIMTAKENQYLTMIV